MNRRDFLKMSSLATMSAVGMWTGITEAFAHAPEQKEKYRSYNTGLASSMEYRKLGALDVSAIGLGCLPMVGYYGGKYDKHEMIALIRRAYDEGVTFFDTAEVYGPHTSEEWVGEAVAPFRNKIKIGTKFGFGVEEVAGVVKELILEGKVLHWGMSEASARSIRRAHAVCPLSAVQSEYAIWWREPETKIFPTLEELGIGFVPYCPLGRAFLTGVIHADSTFSRNDRRWNLPQFQPEALKHNMPLVYLVQQWAERKGITPAQFALVWMLSRKPWIAPIPGTTNPQHLDDFLGAGKIRLSAWEMEEFDRDYAKIDLMGHRADPFTESQIDK